LLIESVARWGERTAGKGPTLHTLALLVQNPLATVTRCHTGSYARCGYEGLKKKIIKNAP